MSGTWYNVSQFVVKFYLKTCKGNNISIWQDNLKSILSVAERDQHVIMYQRYQLSEEIDLGIGY